MNDLEQVAKDIAIDSHIDPEEKFGSVLVIIMLVGIFINVIRVIQECNKSELAMEKGNKQEAYRNRIKSLSIRRGWYTKMRLKKILRQNMPRDKYKQYGQILCDKILDHAENITLEQTNSLLEVSNV